MLPLAPSDCQLGQSLSSSACSSVMGQTEQQPPAMYFTAPAAGTWQHHEQWRFQVASARLAACDVSAWYVLARCRASARRHACTPLTGRVLYEVTDQLLSSTAARTPRERMNAGAATYPSTSAARACDHEAAGPNTTIDVFVTCRVRPHR